MNAPLPIPAPAPALLVISGGAAMPPDPTMATRTLSPASLRLLGSLPAAQRVLEIGCESPLLAQAYKLRHPGAHWAGISHFHLTLETAPSGIDTLLALDLTQAALTAPNTRFDLIVLHRLERLPDAARLLTTMADWLTPGGSLYVLAENHACLSSIAHLIEADVSTGIAASPEVAASLDVAHPRYQTPSTVYKMLLDAGWMPTLVDHEPDAPVDDRLGAAARYMGEALGVPHGCADRVHRMKHLVIRTRRLFDQPVQPSSQALFDVLVPTTKEQQLRVNVEQSPGLKEVQARILSYRKASSPAQALSESLRHVQSDWVLLCHQDIYFPKGFGQRLNEVLAVIPPEERARTLIGFIGKGVNRQTRQVEPAGFVIDRLNWADHPASDSVVSIDELALVIARDSIHQIDPLIGWHLWATDLCLTAISTHQVFPRIVRLPLFHNTQSGWQLPDAFYDSATYLRNKHPDFHTIHTLCGDIDPGFVARNRSTQA